LPANTTLWRGSVVVVAVAVAVVVVVVVVVAVAVAIAVVLVSKILIPVACIETRIPIRSRYS
jgi:hypothetical protein